MTHDTIDSLSEFLLHAQTRYRVFDLGRGLVEVAHQDFLDIENGQIPSPCPRQAHAWFALSFYQASDSDNIDTQSQYLWFIRLPIDEQSRVISASRNHFLQVIVEALQADPKLDKGLPDNPYIFTPSESQRAQLVCALSNHSKKEIDSRIAPVIGYLQAPGAVDWQKLVTQDIFYAANAINLDDALCDTLLNQWQRYATPFIVSLLRAFEVLELNLKLHNFLCEQVSQLEQIKESSEYLRALSSTQKNINLQALLASRLAKPEQLGNDALSVIAARHYNQLTPGLLRLFFSACLKLDETLNFEGKLFADFYRDLVAIPSLRNDVISILKSLQGSEA